MREDLPAPASPLNKLRGTNDEDFRLFLMHLDEGSKVDIWIFWNLYNLSVKWYQSIQVTKYNHSTLLISFW